MFSLNLKKIRQKLGWTQSKLAKEAEISQAYISELEAGNKQPTVNIVQKLACALGVSITELLEFPSPFLSPYGGQNERSESMK